MLGASGVDSTLKVEVRSWKELQEQLKDNLVDAHKKWATLTTINQLLLLCNFATLQIKGIGRISVGQQIAHQWHDGKGAHFACCVHVLAHHYQGLEQLPTWMAGGYWGCSIIINEWVQNAAWGWLTKLPTGEVSPKQFCRALTEEILPWVGIDRTVAEWTAWWWLVKLGWCWTHLKKGVYMDDHEWCNVVKYRNEVFLLLMAEYEILMMKWIKCKDGTFDCVKPELGPGEKQIITLFQDKSSFHAGKYKSNVWLVHFLLLMVLFWYGCGRLWNDKQKLIKKGHGWIIHMSDLIEENRHLVIQNQDGVIIKDAQCITYPGANSDTWWDLPQLLKQIEKALSNFEEAHPGCCALFIFDQSSVHASLRPEVLCTFDMNRSNGGKQWRQKDTVIPMNNPDPCYHRLMQNMTLGNGEQKGLQQMLEECSFNITGMLGQLLSSLPNQKWRLLHGLPPQPARGLLTANFTPWADHHCLRIPVHLPSKVPLWTQSDWKWCAFSFLACSLF